MKILYVSTISNTINAFMIPHIEYLLNQGHQVDIACNIKKEINPLLTDRGCKIYNIAFQRSPLNKQNFKGYKKIKKLIIEKKYDLIHTHTPIASACVRLACRDLANVKIIYTAHGFHFFKGAPLKNWLLYYSVERYLVKYTDVIITINKEDHERAKHSFRLSKVEYVPGVGFDSQKFGTTSCNLIEKRKEIGIPQCASVILSVGELNQNKNHQTIIKAVALLKNSNIYYVICGEGPLLHDLKILSKKLGVENQVKLLGERTDIAEICKVADVFAFPSFREGLSVALMEAMASKLPVVCSDIRGNRDLVKDKKGGFLVKPHDIEAFAKHIEIVLNSDDMKKSMGSHNIHAIKGFDLSTVIKRLGEIYSTFNQLENNNVTI